MNDKDNTTERDNSSRPRIKEIILLNTDCAPSSPTGGSADTSQTPTAANQAATDSTSEAGQSSSGQTAPTEANEGTLGNPKLEPNEYLFSTFPDGSLFRYCPHPSVEGKFCLLDVNGTVVAVANHRAVADFLVRGAHCLCCYLRDKGAAEETTSKIIPSTTLPK